MKQANIRMIFLVMILSLSVFAAPARIVVGRPGETKDLAQRRNGWVSLVLDSYIHFRLMGFSGVDAVPSDSLAQKMGARGKYGLTQSRGQLNRLAKEFKAKYILQSNYSYDPKAKSVIFKIKLYPLDKSEPVYEKNTRFPLTSTPSYLDTILVNMASSIGYNLNGTERASLRATIFMKDVPVLEKMGQAALKATEAKRHEQVKGELATLAGIERDYPNLWLAHFINAQVNEKHGLNRVAGKSYGAIVKRKSFKWTPMYVNAIRNYRLGGSYREAAATLKDAEKAGASGVRLDFESASVKAAMGQYADAALLFKKVLKAEPNNVEALLFMAKYGNDTQKYASVFPYTKRLIANKTAVAQAYVENGKALLGQKKISAALAAFEKADAQPGNSYEANYQMGNIYMKKKQYTEAAKQYSAALKGINDDEGLLLKASMAFQRAGDIRGAQTVLENYASLFPKSLKIERELGLVYFEVKDTVKAQAALERCRTMDPPSKEVFLTLAEIYKGQRNWQEVIANYERALPLVKDEKADVLFGIGRGYLNLKKFDDAEKTFRQVVAIDIEYPDVNTLLGELLFRKKAYKEAITFFNNERTYHKNSVKIQERIVEANFILKFYKTAKKEALTLLSLDSKSVMANTYLARIAMIDKQYASAKKYLDQAIALGTVDAAIYLELARGFSAGQKWEEARMAYIAYLKVNPNDDKVWVEVAQVYYNMADDDRAVRAYSKAYAINPKDNADALAKAGHIIYGNKDFGKAEEFYAKFINSGSVDDSVLVNYATIKMENGDFAGAIVNLDKLSPASKKDKRVVRLYAIAYYETKDDVKAKSAIEQTLVNYPNSIDMHEIAALYYVRVGDLTSAAREYEKVIALGGKKYQKLYGYSLAQIYTKLKQDDKAISWYEKNVRTFPGSYLNHIALADYYLQRKEYKKNVALLAPVVTKKDAPVILNKPLAISYKEIGEEDKAAQAYTALLSTEQNDSTAWFELGTIYYKQKEYQDAIPALTKATAQMPTHKWAHYRLASSLYRVDEAAKAQEVLGKIWAVHPDDSDILGLYTKVLGVTKDTATTIKVYEKRATLEHKNFDLNVELGEIYTALGQKDNAAKAYTRALKIDPTSYEIRMKLIAYYKAQKNEPVVQKLVTAGLKYHAKSAPLYYERGLSYLRLGQKSEALSAFVKATKLNSSYHEAFYNAGLLYKEEGDRKKARTFFGKAVAASPKNVEYRLALARIQMADKDYAGAVYQGKKILPLAAENGEVFAEVGTFFEAAGDTSRAEELYNESLIYDDKCGVCYRNLGAINYNKLRYQAAEINLEKAVKLGDTTDAIAAMYLGDIKRSNGDSTQAVTLFEKALSLEPNSDKILFKYLNSLIETGDLALAKKVFKKYKNNPRTSWFLMAQGRMAEAQGDLQAAANYYDHAIKTDEQSGPAYIGLGRIALEHRDNSTAMMQFGMAMGYDPANIETYILMAKSFFRDKDYDNTYELLKEALTINPKYPDIYYYMAMVHSRKREHEKAVKILRQALTYNQERPRIHYALGTELRLTVQSKAAIAEFEEALKYDKDGSYAIKVYKQMGDIYYEQLLDNKNAKKYYKRYIRAGGKSQAVLEKLSTL